MRLLEGTNHEWKDLGGHRLLIGRSISVVLLPKFHGYNFCSKEREYS